MVVDLDAGIGCSGNGMVGMFALERVRVGSGRGRFWGKEGLERRRIVLFVLGFLLARGSGFFESVCGRSVPAPEDWIFWKHGCSCREHDGAQKRTEEKVSFGGYINPGVVTFPSFKNLISSKGTRSEMGIFSL